MKKLLTIGILFFFIAYPAYAFTPTTAPTAATTNPTPTSTQGLVQQIDELKDRIASRVAQLKLVEKKGVIGTVIDVAETQLSISDVHGNTIFIDVDELTKFSSPSVKTSFGISDISKGTTVGILGLYNKESRRILARFVDVMSVPVVLSGAVTGIDSTNFNLTLTTLDKKDLTIDVENITRTYTYGKTTGLVKAGFSKITQGERLMVIGFPDAKDKNKILASRILRFPDLPINPVIALFKPEDIGVTPSTGSGTKLVPIIRNK
jgi:hypothetical protein